MSVTQSLSHRHFSKSRKIISNQWRSTNEGHQWRSELKYHFCPKWDLAGAGEVSPERTVSPTWGSPAWEVNISPLCYLSRVVTSGGGLGRSGEILDTVTTNDLSSKSVDWQRTSGPGPLTLQPQTVSGSEEVEERVVIKTSFSLSIDARRRLSLGAMIRSKRESRSHSVGWSWVRMWAVLGSYL